MIDNHPGDPIFPTLGLDLLAPITTNKEKDNGMEDLTQEVIVNFKNITDILCSRIKRDSPVFQTKKIATTQVDKIISGQAI